MPSRPRLRQGAAHGEDLRRQRVVPLRHAGQHADGQGPRARAVAHVRAAQGQAGGVSGCPRNCAEAGIKDVGVIGVDSGWEIYVAGNGGIKTEVAQFFVQAEDRRRGAGVHRRLPAAVPRGRLVPGAHRALRRPRRPGPREEEGPRRRAKAARRCGSGCSSRSTASPIPWFELDKAQRRHAAVRAGRVAAAQHDDERLDSRSAGSTTSRCSARAAWRAPRGDRRRACSATPRTRCSRCSTAARTRAGR